MECNSPFNPFSLERSLDEVQMLVEPFPKGEVPSPQLVLYAPTANPTIPTATKTT